MEDKNGDGKSESMMLQRHGRESGIEKLKKCDKRENANDFIIFLLIAKKREKETERERRRWKDIREGSSLKIARGLHKG